MMFEETGCAGVSIGRGAFYNPWIFRHTRHFLETGELPPEPEFDERVRVMCRHLDLMVEVFGEELGCRMFRKVAPWYSKRFGPANEFNKKVVLLNTRAEFHALLEKYRDWRRQFLDETGTVEAGLSARADGGVVHAGTGRGATRTYPRAQRAGGGLVAA